MCQVLAIVIWATASLAAGCGAHRHVGRPPSPGEIAWINEMAREEGAPEPLRVRATGPARCTSGSYVTRDCVDALPRYDAGQARIEAADADKVTFRGVDGRIQEIPLAMVAGVSVRNRLRPPVIGASVLGASMGAITWVFIGTVEGNGACSWQCARTSGIALLTGAALGALIGHVVGGRTAFLFDRPPARP